jgi:hypothetical protein
MPTTVAAATATTTATTPEHTAYEARLRTLSEASTEQHFDAFLDIAWADPAYAVDPTDERWILPEADVLGRHPWYRSLPREEQIRVGLYRQANVTKVGLQFEQVLVSGLMYYAFGLRNGTPEFRYVTHEATEECHHTQMFQEFVNRSGVDVAGSSRLFRRLAPVLPLAARLAPYGFFLGVLAGEEPIDHTQKAILRAESAQHPLIRRIMQIHVAEEARHIGFAHAYLEHRSGRLSRVERAVMSLVAPVIMRWLADVILIPSRQARRDMGIPRSVVRDVYWRDPESRQTLRDLFGDVRMLCADAGLMNPVSLRLWRLLKIDGRPSRFRSEPAPVG